MKRYPVVFSLFATLLLSSCGVSEDEEAIDYDNIVLADEEEEWTTGQGEGVKLIAGELPEPQEVLLNADVEEE
jgi:hypothetical protein